jgi:nucleoside-diphosphate-sugar epimerase
MANRRVLVTGAGGFIGAHLVNRLDALGAAVCGLDIRPQTEAVCQQWVTTDVLDLGPTVVAEFQPDVIFHLAAIVGVGAAAADPAATRRSIVEGTRRVLDAAASTSKPDIVFVSSSEVYGETRRLPITEHTPRAPRSPYARAKAEAEELVRDYARIVGGHAVVIRPFNVYGPGQRPEFVISKFVAHALRDEELPVLGDGRQTRTFTYVQDFVDGMIGALQCGYCGFFNIAGAEAVAIEAAARLVIDEIGAGRIVKGLSPRSLGRPSGAEVRHRVASCGAAARRVGFVPRVSLREGIRRVAEQMRTDLAVEPRTLEPALAS